MALVRPYARRGRISLVPLIDVLFILLVYFMVTSVYLDLDMVPVVDGGDAVAGAGQGGDRPTLLVRLDATGAPVLRGAVLTPEGLTRALADAPGARVLILPSGAAPLQALAGVLDMLNGAGVRDAQLVRLEGT